MNELFGIIVLILAQVSYVENLIIIFFDLNLGCSDHSFLPEWTPPLQPFLVYYNSLQLILMFKRN